MKYDLLVYSPNTNSGGALELIKAIYGARKDTTKRIKFILPLSLRSPIKNYNIFRTLLRNNFFNFIYSNISLFFYARHSKVIFIFNNLPTLFTGKKRIIFFQNILILNSNAYRYKLQRVIFSIFRRDSDIFIVQNYSTFITLSTFIPNKILIMPFSPKMPVRRSENSSKKKRILSFYYPALGYKHKNHINLFKALILLSYENIFPKLILTLPRDNRRLISLISELNCKYNLQIVNLGHLSHHESIKLIQESSALIFPSLSESFGLPIFEAYYYKTPILAGELDFVRDICDPIEVFDPTSALSISRAIKRFLNLKSNRSSIISAEDFLLNLFKM